eukprot:UN03610
MVRIETKFTLFHDFQNSEILRCRLESFTGKIISTHIVRKK